MARLLTVHPLRPSAAGRHRRWCEEVRARRREFAASREAVGIVRQVCWLQPQLDLAVVRVDGADPAASVAALATSAAAFDRWYASMEREIHGSALSEAGSAELLSEYENGSVDPFDMFVAAAVPLLPGRTDEYCARIARSVESGDGHARVERWGLTQMAVWLQRYRGGPVRDAFDAVVFELTGDVPGMLRILATADDADSAAQRALARECFGLDWALEPFPLPDPAYAWSAHPIG
jgi:hypothetical protein